MIERILIPTDGSKGTRRAVELGVDLADRYGAEVHGLFVVDILAQDWDPAVLDSVMDFTREEGERATGKIREIANDHGVKAVSRVIRGHQAREEILEYVQENDIDLIVMGTHGKSGLDRFLLGSTAQRVVRTSPVPVLTVPMKETADV